MQAFRATAIGAALFVSGSFAAGAQGSGAVAPAHRSTHIAAAAPAKAPAAAATAEPVKVNDFMSYEPSTKTVMLKVLAAFNSTNGGMNFNGGANGSHTIIVPQGWTVQMAFTNQDAIPHSAIVLADKMPFPAQPQDPAIPRAYTADVTGGLMTGKSDRTTFKAGTPAKYLLACGVPGHAPSGMWIHFVVSADATTPAYTK